MHNIRPAYQAQPGEPYLGTRQGYYEAPSGARSSAG